MSNARPDEMVILPDDPTAATYRTDIKGWVSRLGHFYGDGSQGERMARYDGSTHNKCDACGAPARKNWLKCDPCLAKADRERYLELPLVEWDGETPLAIFHDDTYFFDLDSVYDHCDANDISVSDLELVICEPRYLHEFDALDYWQDELPEDADLPADVEAAVDALNAVIRNRKGKEQSCWFPGKARVSIPSQVNP